MLALIVGALTVLGGSVAAAPEPSPELSPEPSPVRIEIEEERSLSIGPRFGMSLNGDQWLAGGHLLLENLCLDGVGVEPILLVGLGGNHATIRTGLRAGFTFWIGGVRGVGLMPMVGADLSVALPVGDFARFCSRTQILGCDGVFLGYEIGAGVRYRWFRLEAMAGFADLPVFTTTFALDLPLGGSAP